MTRAEFLIFDTDFSCRRFKKKIKDGKVVIGDKEWVVDKAQPFHLKKGLGYRPLYLLKWNSVFPRIKRNIPLP